VLDLGVILGTIAATSPAQCTWGGPQKRIRTWYQAVLEAQTAAIAAAKSGAACGDVDGRRGKSWQAYHLAISSFTARATGFGLEVHEIPGWAGAEVAPRAGNVITMNPACIWQASGGFG